MTHSATDLKVMLLGAGDAGGELEASFRNLGATVVVVEDCAGAEDFGTLFGRHVPSHVVATSSAISADVLIAAAEVDGVEVLPTPRATRLSLDPEGLRRLAADELGLPTVPFWFAGSVEELTAVVGHAGFPLTITPASGARTEGRSVVVRPDDIEAAWKAATEETPGSARVMAETVVEFDDEITLLTVRTTGSAGPAVHFCEPIGHRVRPDGALEAWQPHAMSLAALDAARSIAARIVNSLGGRGVFGVELLLKGDEVYFSTVHAQLSDVGLVTLRSQRLTQFELQARAILGLPLDAIAISPAAVEVVSGDADPAGLGEALTTPETDVRLTSGLTAALATAPDVVRARDRAHRVASALSITSS